jgi:hypothetical protein
MAKVEFNPIIKWLTGKIGKLVYRRSHNGKVSVYPSPDMSKVKWSPAQKAQRQKMKEAAVYASAALDDPDLRLYYLQMAMEVKQNKRPFDMAVHDYFQGNNLLLKKHLEDQKRTLPVQ